MNFKNILLLSLTLLIVSCKNDISKEKEEKEINFTDYVNPFIGTAPLTDPEVIGYTPPEGWRVWAGLTYPGATLPNAMVQLSPITEFGTGAGYHYEDTVIHAFIGKPEKSQKIIDHILNNMYGLGKSCLAFCGMDDAGEMSAWYVFSALGLYPFSPADTEYLVTVPIFDEVRWKLGNGKELIINKPEDGRKLDAIRVNGEALEGYFISHDLFKKGGELDIVTESHEALVFSIES